MITFGIALPADGLLFAKRSSQRLLELEMGTAIAGGSIEYFAQFFGARSALRPYVSALRCLDQSTVITGTDNLVAHMLAMNSTSSQIGLAVASQEVQCNGKSLFYSHTFGSSLVLAVWLAAMSRAN